MRPLVQYGSRSSWELLFRPSVALQARLISSNSSHSTFPPPCLRCQMRALLSPQRISSTSVASSKRFLGLTQTVRTFRTSAPALDDEKKQALERKLEEAVDFTREDAGHMTIKSPLVAPVSVNANSTLSLGAQEALPSNREQQRSDSSKRIAQLMEEAQERIVILTHKVNNYTGTDYSGIQALRKQIQEQEEEVKARRAAIVEAKYALDAAFAQKATSQKEVVGLLERKHSWSDSDLERYMSLVRSEHLNDQGVQNAKDKVSQAERDLEEARAQLEKVERKQYHEEQIWSDTIRRNSTWVTFGLMGFNVLVLLASIALLEPWRRRRLVREIRSALEEHRPIVAHSDAASAATATEIVVDNSVEPARVSLEALTAAQNLGDSKAIVEEPRRAEPVVEVKVEPVPVAVSEEILQDVHSAAFLTPRAPTGRVEEMKTSIAKLFSEGNVTMRQVDITTLVLQGFTAGAAVVGLLVVLLRPK